MKAMINVGNEITKDDTTIKAAAEAIVAIIKIGAETRTEQETVRAAIKALSELSPVKNVNIAGSTFTNSIPDNADKKDTVREREEYTENDVDEDDESIYDSKDDPALL